MSITKQTRCPHCTSVFNITDVQLAARGGHVRCGSCLQVFRADQHLVDGNTVVNPVSSSHPVSTSSSTHTPVPQSMPIMAKEQYSAPQPQSTTASTTKKKKKDDESWAMDLLGDLGAELEDDLANLEAKTPKVDTTENVAPPPTKAAKPAKKPLFDDEISDLLQEAWVESSDATPLKGLSGVDKIKESADESWAQALMSELEEEEKKEKAKNYSMELAPQRPKDTSRKKEPPVEKADMAPASKSTNSSKPEQDDDLLSFLNNNASASNTLKTQSSLPLEIKGQPMISINWSYWLTWSFMCILAVMLLGVQYVYFNFNDLAFNDKTRPQLMQLCESIGCHVPEPPNASLITIQKLVIRKHPQTKNALQINAIIFNKADFAQPLPALKLTFLNKKRDISAARAFQPKEYLQGDAAKNLRRIPPETPIHIQLDIVDPKVDMTSYKMKPLYQ